jgi:hypothetical protein
MKEGYSKRNILRAIIVDMISCELRSLEDRLKRKGGRLSSDERCNVQTRMRRWLALPEEIALKLRLAFSVLMDIISADGNYLF